MTVIGAFTFGYFAAHFAGLDVPWVSIYVNIHISFVKITISHFQAVFCGLGLALLVFLADLYFLVKTPSLVENKKRH